MNLAMNLPLLDLALDALALVLIVVMYLVMRAMVRKLTRTNDTLDIIADESEATRLILVELTEDLYRGGRE